MLFSYSCSNTRKFTITYKEPSAKILTLKPIIVRSLNKSGNHVKSILINELKNNGYEIIQDIEITQNLTKPFRASQISPTKDFSEVFVSMELDHHTEHNILQTTKVRLSYCNNLVEKNKCTHRPGSVRWQNTITRRSGKIYITILNAGEDPVEIVTAVAAESSGIIPKFTNVALSKSIRAAIRNEFKQYFFRTITVTPDIEIDKMAADLIEANLIAAAAMRIDHEESGYKYYYSMGLIEESRANYTGAKMYYSEGELNTGQKELFADSIKRV
ncbi:uncharacterized protein METZ01_LOCUS104549, partial [marine metagenome]